MTSLKLTSLVLALALSGCAAPSATLTPANAVEALSGNWFGVYQDGKEHYCLLAKHAPNGTYATQFRDVTQKITPYTETGVWTATAGMLVTIPNSQTDAAQRPARSDYVILEYSAGQMTYKSTPDGDTFKAKRVGSGFELPNDCKA
jgi:hypothetical protein